MKWPQHCSPLSCISILDGGQGQEQRRGIGASNWLFVIRGSLFWGRYADFEPRRNATRRLRCCSKASRCKSTLGRRQLRMGQGEDEHE